MSIPRSRPMSILRAIKEATAKHDPSYRLKKRGLLNAHDMKRLIPSREKLIYGYEDKGNGFVQVSGDGPIKLNTPTILDDCYGMMLRELYADNGAGQINITDTIKALKG